MLQLTGKTRAKPGEVPGLLASVVFAPVLLVSAILPAQSQQIEVDAELVLAVDVSRSMTQNELEIQRRGYAEALASADVISAITSGLLGRVAIQYVEWAGEYSQRIVVDWTLISSAAEAEAFASKLTAHFDSSMRRTSISGGLTFAANSLETNNFIANRRIIDVSGDGPNNQGLPVEMARDDVLARGMVINGLPLMTREGAGSQFHLENLDVYYENCVIGGPASFVLPVLTWEEFPAAVRQKLILELAGLAPPRREEARIIKASDAGAEEGYDCLIGEKIWEQRRWMWQDP